MWSFQLAGESKQAGRWKEGRLILIYVFCFIIISRHDVYNYSNFIARNIFCSPAYIYWRLYKQGSSRAI